MARRPKAKKCELWTVPDGSRFKTPEEEYIYGEDIGVADLAKKWESKKITLTKRCSRDKWVKKRDAFVKQQVKLFAKKQAKINIDEKICTLSVVKNAWFIAVKQIQAKLCEVDANNKIKKGLDGEPIPSTLAKGDLDEITRSLARAQENLADVLGIDFEAMKHAVIDDKVIQIRFGFGKKDKYRSKL